MKYANQHPAPVSHEKTKANSHKNFVSAAGVLCRMVSESVVFYSGAYILKNKLLLKYFFFLIANPVWDLNAAFICIVI